MIIVLLKGIFCGGTSFVLAVLLGERAENLSSIVFALLLGAVAYGLSIFVFVYAQRIREVTKRGKRRSKEAEAERSGKEFTGK